MEMVYKKKYRVHVYETGPGGKLSLYSLFNYLQDIASDHAETLGFGRDDLLKDNRFWVLSRMYLEINRLPLWEETVDVSTWPSGTESLFALRNYEVSGSDGVIIRGSSSWLILDRDSKRVQRPDNVLSRFEFPVRDNNIRNSTKLNIVGEQAVTDHCFRIKASDLDVNLHTNNAVYVRWITDSYDLGYIMNNDPQSVEINYLAESRFGDEINVRTSADKDYYDHSIIRTDDKKEICRIRIGWTKV
ncbi:MAG TPA: acyl-ACP thioesterase domain-containing protein [Bacteroidales bacterium]|nr:acyl-ACP thioesterase domain-containing protein [Bacteroidales bacterium]